MGKLSKEEAARFSGAAWALRRIEEIGLDEFRKELEWRNVMGIPCTITKAQLHDFEDRNRLNILQTVLLMSMTVLVDEFEFNRDMLLRFRDRFNFKTSCLVDDYVNWEDLQKTLRDELKVECPLNDEILDMRKEDK